MSNWNMLRSPACVKRKSTPAGRAVHPAAGGSFSVSRPLSPSGLLFTISTASLTVPPVIGTIGDRGVTFTASAGTTISSRSSSPYGRCGSRRWTGAAARTATPLTA